MALFKQFLKNNITPIIIAVLAILVLIIALKPTKPKAPNGLRAKFAQVAGSSIQAIQFSLTTPDSFGTGGTKFLAPIIYMLDCGTTSCPTTKPSNPSIDALIGQTIFNNILNAEDPSKNWITQSGALSPGWDTNLSGPVSGIVAPVSTAATGGLVTLTLVPGHWYWFGMGFRNDVKSVFSKDPFNTLISDFDYVALQYTDVVGPSKPTINTANFTS